MSRLAVVFVPTLRIGVLQVEVEGHEIDARRHPDQGVRPAPPPARDHLRVAAGILEAVLRQRRLVSVGIFRTIDAREDGIPLSRQVERRGEQCGAAFI